MWMWELGDTCECGVDRGWELRIANGFDGVW